MIEKSKKFFTIFLTSFFLIKIICADVMLLLRYDRAVRIAAFGPTEFARPDLYAVLWFYCVHLA